MTTEGLDMDFTVIDVETANPDQGSICSIGAARFRNGVLVDKFYTLCNPRQKFTNTWLHNISEEDVHLAPLLGDALGAFSNFASKEKKLVSHTSFDKIAMRKAFGNVGQKQPNWKWFDSSIAVKRAWAEYSVSGYALSKISKVLGIGFLHHNALEDARAAGLVLIEAFNKWSGESEELWEKIGENSAILQRQAYYQSNKIKPKPNPEGEFFGQYIAFTGALDNLLRKDAITLAASVGLEEGNFTLKTNMLVTGQASIVYPNSSKLKAAIKAMQSGREVRIIGEDDFIAMCK